MKATEQYFPVVLFVILFKVVPTFEFVDQILKYDLSKSVRSFGAVCYVTEFGS